jgi:hypothetical protein
VRACPPPYAALHRGVINDEFFQQYLPPLCIRGGEGSLIKCVFVTELFHVYGPSLLAAGIGSATVIWQINKGNDEVKKELKKEIQDVCTDLRTEVQGVLTDLRTEIQGVQSIALGSAYVTMRALSGKKDIMASWMQDIEKCVRSDGKDCASVKGIANAQNKK